MTEQKQPMTMFKPSGLDLSALDEADSFEEQTNKSELPAQGDRSPMRRDRSPMR